MSYKGRYVAKKKPVVGRKSSAAEAPLFREVPVVKEKSRSWKKPVLIVLLVILLLLLLVGTAVVVYWYNTIGKINLASNKDATFSAEQQASIENALTIDHDNAVDSTNPTDELVDDPDEYIKKTPKVINILLVGQDMRDGQTWKLSDSMILFTINQEEKTLTMTSFLRDMYVKLPNYAGHTCGYNRINTCYSLGYSWNGTIGAMEMLDQCLLENFGVQVDYNVEIDFVAFEKIVDIMGGVDIELTRAEANHMNKSTNWGLSEGVNHLNGEQALAYARIRKIDNDFYRTNRQRTVINVLIEKCRGLSLGELNELLQTILPMVTTDMDSSVITEYALDLLPLIPELEVTSQAIPAEGTYYYANKGTEEEPLEVIVPNLEKNRQILADTIGG